MLLSVAYSALQYFPTIFHKWNIFKKKGTEHKMCVLIFSTVFTNTFHILRKLSIILSDMYIGLDVKYPLFLSDVHET